MISGIGQSSAHLASQIFSRLDTRQQGYIEKADLATAFSQIGDSGSSDSSSSGIDEVFTALDGDSDGKVTENELSSALGKLKEELDSQFSQMRMQGMPGQGPQGMGGGMPPPPPSGSREEESDSGFTVDELSSQLEEIGSSDSQRSSLIASIVDNFDAADSDGDGKVNRSEAMSYGESLRQTSTGGSTDSSSSSQDSGSSDSSSNTAVMKKIMQLIHAYGQGGQEQSSSELLSRLSVSA